MKINEYASHDALSLAALVKNGEVSAEELISLGLKAIAIANPKINAIIETYTDAKPIPADSLNLDEASFYGVPFLLKDIGAHDANVNFELGSRLAKGLRAPPFASELIKRFKKSGVSILGRTNLPELGSSCTTEPLLYGPTRNPWNTQKTPGGSSGGAAAAVAAGIVPIAHANDAGGSIRWPASCCGLFGLKPSRNLNPVGPDTALSLNGMAAELIVSRSVRDTTAMLDVTAGPDIGAWCYTPRLTGSYQQEAKTPDKKLRIGINMHPVFPPVELQSNVVDAVKSTAELCESLGHEVEESTFEFDHERLLESFSIIWSTSLRAGIEGIAKMTGRTPGEDTLEPHILLAYRDSEKVSPTQLHWALENMNEITRAYGHYFQKYDLMLNTTGAQEPFDIGKFSAIKADSFYEWFIQMCSHCPFTSTVNIAGIPAMSVPLSWSTSGLPLGSHFIAGAGEELKLLKLATQLEAAQPWANKIPPHHITNLT